MSRHLVFFNDRCPLCQRAVRHIIEIDHNKEFLFAPFRGKMASQVLTGPLAYLSKENSLVLAEEYQSTGRLFWSKFRASWRIYWLIGKRWKAIGLLFFLPKSIDDLLYKKYGAHRHQYSLDIREPAGPSDRFLA